MSLATFIIENIDEILDEWVEFARTLGSSEGLDLAALQNHARQMLLVVASEMTTPQSDREQKVKSRGEAPADPAAPDSDAQTHGDVRYLQGFKLEELIAEYRALRATVIRLWTSRTHIDDRTVYELTRFSEGIDQLTAESVANFSRQLDHSRQLFMGVLGHDLRTDLHVILASADRLAREPTKEQIERYVPHIKDSVQRATSMVQDLLDVTRTHFGVRLPIESTRVDAACTCEAVLQPFRHLHPNCELRLHIEGDLVGVWDGHRLEQMLGNLVRNAIQHGDPSSPITLSAIGEDDEVIFSVHNYGPAIPHSLMTRIFEPMQQGSEGSDRTSLGLGLYIARVIAQAHAGSLSVSSSDAEGTAFTVRLPRGSIALAHQMQPGTAPTWDRAT
jgi:signal transduction histidine kinase